MLGTRYHHDVDMSELKFSSLLSVVFGGVSFYSTIITDCVSGSVEPGSV